jgi:hypothetical protein
LIGAVVSLPAGAEVFCFFFSKKEVLAFFLMKGFGAKEGLLRYARNDVGGVGR